MKFLWVLCFVAAAWAKKNTSAPVAHILFHHVGFGISKSGTCPYVGHPFFHPTCVQCTDDFQCPFYQKCCWDGTCKRCMNPHSGNIKVCPNYAPRPLQGCNLECLNDKQCPQGKCCNYGCSSICVPLPIVPPPPTTAAPTTAAPTTAAPTTAAPTTAAPTTAAPTTAAPTTAAPTTAAPTTAAPTTAAPTFPPQTLCPPGPSEGFCRKRCFGYVCFWHLCIYCVNKCYDSAVCPSGMICCRDKNCNMLCTQPYSGQKG